MLYVIYCSIIWCFKQRLCIVCNTSGCIFLQTRLTKILEFHPWYVLWASNHAGMEVIASSTVMYAMERKIARMGQMRRTVNSSVKKVGTCKFDGLVLNHN